MRFSSWLSLGISVGVASIAACGGSVSLGSASGELGAGDGGGADSGGVTECTNDLCGPAFGLACSDGSSPSGRCLKQSNGTCAWENPGCPTTVDAGPPSGGVCFSEDGKPSPDDSIKSCQTADDCMVLDFQANCCGTHYAAGVAKTHYQAAKTCVDARAAGFPGCGCAQFPTTADDGTKDDGTSTAQVTCRNNKCETTFKGEACGKYVCTANQTCCGPMPLPEATCVEGANSPCPISQRKMKKDITYLSEDDKQRLSSSLMSFPLATYRYKTEGAEQTPHLGFIIDDVAPSPAVLQSGERVDLYGYSTMTVAALQVQANQIAELKKQVDTLQRECVKKPTPKK